MRYAVKCSSEACHIKSYILKLIFKYCEFLLTTIQLGNKMENINVTITDGEIKGNLYKTPSGKEYYSFTGIPYAEPPTGNLRFKAPVPIKPWNGVKETTNDYHIFAHYDYLLTNAMHGTEELIVNVYTPQLPEKGKPPVTVIVFIHGGGFIRGSGMKDEFGPDYLIEKDVVVVTIQYRLSVFGFLCLDIPEAPGNVGLKDQVLALKWIRKNISAFNGNPNNVTILGTSAGAASVELHLVSPMSKNLFHKAIGMSGSMLNPWSIAHNPIEQAFELAKHLGKEFTDKKQLLEYFLKAPAEELASACKILHVEGTKSMTEGIAFAFIPVIEKQFEGVQYFLTEHPIDLLKSGRHKIVPFLTGYCEQEGSIIPPMRPERYEKILSTEDLTPFIQFEINDGEAALQKFNSYYIKKLESEEKRKAHILNFYTDSDFAGGIIVSAKLQAASNPDVYLYKFCFDGSFNSTRKLLQLENLPKATHADQEGYVARLAMITEEGTAVDRLCRERMVLMFTIFAKIGNPIPKTTPMFKTFWEPITENKVNCMNINKELIMEDVDEVASIWEEIYRKYPQLGLNERLNN